MNKHFFDKYVTDAGYIPLTLILVLFQFLDVTFIPPFMTNILEIRHLNTYQANWLDVKDCQINKILYMYTFHCPKHG